MKCMQKKIESKDRELKEFKHRMLETGKMIQEKDVFVHPQNV